MSLDAILEAVHEFGRTEVAKIEAQAQDQVEFVIVEAQAEAHKIQKEAWATQMSQAKRNEDRIMLEANSQVLKIFGEASQGFIRETLNRTRERLKNLRSCASYAAVFHHLTTEALENLYLCLEDDGQVCLRASKLDQELLEPFLNIHFPEVIVNYDLNCWGGVIAQSSDNLIVITNTLDERFERSKPYLQHHLAVWFERYKNMPN